MAVDEADDFLAQVERESARRLVRLHVPKRYQNAQIDSPVVQEWAEHPEGVLYLTGPTGTGKSYAAWAVVAHYLGRLPGGSVLFAGGRVASLLDSMQPGRLDDDLRGTLQDPLIRAQQAGLLLLDDLGAHKVSEWREEQLYKVVDERYNNYNNMVPTVITTNLGPSELGGMVGERVASRVAEDCVVVPFVGQDRRRAKSFGLSSPKT